MIPIPGRIQPRPYACRTGLGMVVAIALLIMLASCSSGADLAGRSDRSGSDQPVTGGNLRVNVASDPASMHPWQYASGVDRNVLFAIYEPIIELRLTDFTLQPAIAQSWSVDESGRIARLAIRQKVVFHDERDLTAADVAFSIRQAMDKKASRTSELLSVVDQITTPDQYTVELRLSQPDRELFNTLSDVLVAPAEGSSDYAVRPIGTGPFKFQSWNRGRDLTLVKNERYWRSGRPYLDSIRFGVVSDQTTSLMQLQSGQTDIVDQVSFAAVEQARSAGLELRYPEQGLPTGLYEIFLNTRRPPFNDERVRQAISAAIDRPRLKQVLAGVYTVASNPVPTDSPNFDPTALSYDVQDLTRARNLLAEAGYPDGVDAGTLYVYSNLGLDYITAAQVIQHSVGQAGIKLAIRQLDIASWADQVLVQQDYTAGFGAAVAKPSDYDRIAHTWAKALGAVTGWQEQNPQFYVDLKNARRATTEAEYSAALRKAQKAAMAGQPIVVVGGRRVPVGLSPAVGGFVASPQGYLVFRDVWR